MGLLHKYMFLSRLFSFSNMKKHWSEWKYLIFCCSGWWNILASPLSNQQGVPQDKNSKPHPGGLLLLVILFIYTLCEQMFWKFNHCGRWWFWIMLVKEKQTNNTIYPLVVMTTVVLMRLDLKREDLILPGKRAEGQRVCILGRLPTTSAQERWNLWNMKWYFKKLFSGIRFLNKRIEKLFLWLVGWLVYTFHVYLHR